MSARIGGRPGAARAVLFALTLALGTGVSAQEPSAREILDRVETLLWGKTVQGEYEMTITTPRCSAVWRCASTEPEHLVPGATVFKEVS